VDDAATAVSHNGNWGHASEETGPYAGTNSYSDATGDTATLSFVGTGVTLHAVTAPSHGMAGVSVDGGADALVDLYSAQRTGDVSVWTSPRLASGKHLRPGSHRSRRESPIILIGVLFGFAMDYEVFLISGMREEGVHTGRARRSVVEGARHSVRGVTAAALIMFTVFAGFFPLDDALIKPIAFAPAVGVAIDAFAVRMTLVPAVLALTGRHAWWLPAWLGRVLPDLDVEGTRLRKAPEVAPKNLSESADRRPSGGAFRIRPRLEDTVSGRGANMARRHPVGGMRGGDRMAAGAEGRALEVSRRSRVSGHRSDWWPATAPRP
jgi:hypothetical protein